MFGAENVFKCGYFRLYGRQQKHAVAQEYFDKVLDVGEKLYSRDGIELIPVYQGMGRVSLLISQLRAFNQQAIYLTFSLMILCESINYL